MGGEGMEGKGCARWQTQTNVFRNQFRLEVDPLAHSIVYHQPTWPSVSQQPRLIPPIPGPESAFVGNKTNDLSDELYT